MTRRELVLGTHREAIKAAAAANRATSIALVGSVARGDDDAGSDVDFLATFEEGVVPVRPGPPPGRPGEAAGQ